MFDVACKRNHRLVDVLEVNRRPLALGIDTTFVHGDAAAAAGSERWWRWVPSPSGGGALDHRGRLLCLRLDLPYEVVSLVDGLPVQNRYTFTNARGRGHCSEPISLRWLRGLVESGQRRRVIINDETRYSMRKELGG
jgi:hypothetical protein